MTLEERTVLLCVEYLSISHGAMKYRLIFVSWRVFFYEVIYIIFVILHVVKKLERHTQNLCDGENLTFS